MTDNAITVDQLTVAYDGHPVLWNVDVKFLKGQRTAIVGPNGAGKSTLLNGMLGLLKPIAGQVTYQLDGESYRYEEVKRRLAYVPQRTSVDWDFPTSALDVVLMGRYGHLKFGQRPSKEDREIAKMNLERVGMGTFPDRQISQLSGGQRQRVFLARALCEDADIIILDEPLAGVDMKTEKILMDLLRQQAELGRTVIAVHHDLDTVEDYFDQVVFLNREVVAAGPVKEFYTAANIEETYRQDHNLGEG